ncbi:hypothetical protein GCM10011519_07780 [Marmoricola endophyticus]|uniref:HipA-like kinase domain-containing protein n=1 Tax=Marmoricola endophyticus TaxID=2040280 RepID=A0A917BD94_9ACTN|nr:HipA family kinase [Marmoricola endophyticus]GGF36678.1 hypothetical protein GCM10011519_07780 [Marmoricola endophyticus]
MSLQSVRATRFVAPLREGGSLPGIVEADDLGTYVAKFRGAGQGLNVLVAEVVVAGLARALGLDTPRLVVVELEEAIARYEADEEVQDLLTASLGANLGVDFLPGSFGFDTSVDVDPEWAGRVLWLDAFVANVDRSWRNPNLLVWHGRPWLIDHGASLYFHHGWAGGLTSPERFAVQPWDASAHVLSRWTASAAALDDALAGVVTDEVLETAVADVPDEWLVPVPGAEDAAALRTAYVDFLRARRDGGRTWLPGSAR